MGQHAALVLQEDLEKGELLGREGDPLAVDEDLMPGWIDADRAVFDHGRTLLDRVRLAQVGIDAGQQHFGAEWLGDIVVGAGIERHDRLAVVMARRQHDDRHV